MITLFHYMGKDMKLTRNGFFLRTQSNLAPLPLESITKHSDDAMTLFDRVSQTVIPLGGGDGSG